jgi:hypothetical protein
MMMDRHGNTDGALRGLLSKLFGGWSMGAGQAPTIGGASALSPATVEEGRTRMRDTLLAAQNAQAAQSPPMPAAPTDSQAAMIAQNNMNGPMTDANLPPMSPSRPRRAPPTYDYAAMDALTAPITEGPNANIDDATRQRALEWALRNNP